MFKPLGLWYFVMAAQGNNAQIRGSGSEADMAGLGSLRLLLEYLVTLPSSFAVQSGQCSQKQSFLHWALPQGPILVSAPDPASCGRFFRDAQGSTISTAMLSASLDPRPPGSSSLQNFLGSVYRLVMNHLTPAKPLRSAVRQAILKFHSIQ